jgi:AraC-like DNA-binding protein
MYDFGRSVSLRVNAVSLYRGVSWRILNPAVPFWRVYLPLSFCGILHMGERRIRLTPAAATLIAPYTTFELEPSARPHHLFIHAFAGYPYTLLSGRILQIHSPDKAQPGLGAVIRGLIDACDGRIGNPTSRQLLTALQVVAALLNQVEGDHLEKTDPRIARVDGFMRENIAARFTNDVLADLVEMSPTGFIRFFREHTGSTPARYWNGVRVEQITYLLENTSWPIERIAESCGFSDRYHMSKVFKRMTRISPAEWRRSAEGMTVYPQKAQKAQNPVGH